MSEKRFIMSEKDFLVVRECFNSYAELFGLTMSEKTLLQHFCNYLIKEIMDNE